MPLYALRKRNGQWAVCSAQSVTMLFESYEEALEIARTAAAVVANRTRERGSQQPNAGSHEGYH